MQPRGGTVHKAAGFTGARLGPGSKTVTLDFETYYDNNYTLRKLSTSEYIRDSWFAVISVAIKIGDGDTKVYFGTRDVAKALDAVDWADTNLLAHHAHFDGLILTHHFGHAPRYWLDTLSMARALHPRTESKSLEEVARHYNVINKLAMPDFRGKHAHDLTDEEVGAIRLYNARDVDVTAEVYERMRPRMPANEMDLIDVTVAMFTEPFMELDIPLARRELKREIKERETRIEASNALEVARSHGIAVKPKKRGVKVDNERVLASNKIFSQVLEATGITVPTKISKYNGKETYALSKQDEEFTDLMGLANPVVVRLVDGRLAAKSTIGETRAARLLTSGMDGKRLPVYLNYCGAHTTRWSGGDKLNYQNLKKRGDIRKAIKAPKGFQLVVIDSATIEVRVLAWLAREEWLLEAFRKGDDPYCLFGADVYGRTITKADKLERFVSKCCVLGLGYQMWAPKLQTTILAQSINQGMEPVRLDLDVCIDLASKYRDKAVRTKALWKLMNKEVIDYLVNDVCKGEMEIRGIVVRKGEIQLPGHLSLLYPGAHRSYPKAVKLDIAPNADPDDTIREDAKYDTPMGESKLYGGLLTENVVQYLARIIVAEQMRIISKRHRVVMFTHDEVVFLAKTRDAPAALAWGLEIMKTSPSWAPDLPVSAEGGYDRVYSK